MKRRVERTWVLCDMAESCPSTRLGGVGWCLFDPGCFLKKGWRVAWGLVCTVLDAQRD